MQLSRDREAELIEQNMPKIYRAVDNFMARCDQRHGVSLSYDDCVQEVSVVFLKYIRECDSEEKLNSFPWYNAVNALSRLVINSQALKYPLRTSSFNSILHSLPKTVSYDLLVSSGVDVDGMSKHWVPDKETEIDFDFFMETQDENIRRITAMKLMGMTQRDIAAQCGISLGFVNKILQNLRDDYDEFDREEEEDE